MKINWNELFMLMVFIGTVIIVIAIFKGQERIAYKLGYNQALVDVYFKISKKEEIEK